LKKSQQKLKVLLNNFNEEFEKMSETKKTGRLRLEINIRDGGLSTGYIDFKYGGQVNPDNFRIK